MLLKENINQRIFIKRKLKIIGEILRSFHFDLRFGHFCSFCLIESAMCPHKWHWENIFDIVMLDSFVPFDNTIKVFLLESSRAHPCNFDPNPNKFSNHMGNDLFLLENNFIAFQKSTGVIRTIFILVVKAFHNRDWMLGKNSCITCNTS